MIIAQFYDQTKCFNFFPQVNSCASLISEIYLNSPDLSQVAIWATVTIEHARKCPAMLKFLDKIVKILLGKLPIKSKVKHAF